MLRIGVDVGGTFTDVVMWDDEQGRPTVHKLPSTPSDPSAAAFEGIETVATMAGTELGAVQRVGHESVDALDRGTLGPRTERATGLRGTRPHTWGPHASVVGPGAAERRCLTRRLSCRSAIGTAQNKTAAPKWWLR